MPPKGHATKGGNKVANRPVQPQKSSSPHTGLWQQSLQRKPSQDFTLCEPGKYLTWGREMRLQCETLFTMPVNTKLFDSWTRSEDYWYRKDKEMLEYLQDFPVSKWLIDQLIARAAYDAMQSRFRLRDEGKSVYTDGVPEYWPYGKPEVGTKVQNNNTALSLPIESGFVKPAPARQPRKPAVALATTSGFTPVNGTKPISERQPRESNTVAASPTEPTAAPAVEAKSRKPRKSAADEAPIPQHDGIIEPKARRAAKNSQTDVDDLSEAATYVHAPPPDVPAHPALNPRKRKAKSFSDVLPVEDDVIELAIQSATVPQEPANEGLEVVQEPPAKKRKVIADANEPEKREPRPKMQKRSSTPPPFDRDPDVLQKLLVFDFPWQNDWAGDDPEEWDDSIYDPARLSHISLIHTRNSKIVTKYMENGKHGAQKRKSAAIFEGIKNDREDEETIVVGEVKTGAIKPHKKRPKLKRSRNADQREHFSGRLDFADDEQEAKFRALRKYLSIEDAIKAAMVNPFDEALKNIEVAHDPGDSLLDNLHLPRISIMDIARTRLQLYHTRIFTDRAAECLIDFCPDLLTNYMLLQVVSETKFGNTGVQIRLGQNGSMLSDSTITKRVSAALNREYDRSGAAEAARKNPDFKKTNRDMYAKYKAWRAHRRQVGFQKVSHFILVESSRLYKQRLEAEELEEPLRIQNARAKSRLRPIEPASPTPPGDHDMGGREEAETVIVADDDEAIEVYQEEVPDIGVADNIKDTTMYDAEEAREDDSGLGLAGEADTAGPQEAEPLPRPKLKLKRRATRASSPGPRPQGQRSMLDFFGSRGERASKRRNTHHVNNDGEKE
ncbi:hypothetical protein K461DRAFT_312163 [Myriangium duriaei CBS 260.36]|uniref:Uncharacterized protein n=1 Tax=Myriangium duriaei CBS 260.36 TaxID=1168546 RepID=A0A9P4MNZ7_9PEZI|nr:hypothetical protein K461DRAFT_312163 [Myriangium duriaei CBS 260.36]